MTRLRDLLYRLLHCCAVAVVMMWPAGGMAFPAEVYAARSVLASGDWVKIAVASSGIHFIPAADLRNMGFADPARVGVYGYGGGRLPDVLDRVTFVDDLPRVPSLVTSSGIYFYAVGPAERDEDLNGLVVMKHNPFSERGYYFLSDCDALPEKEIAQEDCTGQVATYAKTFMECVHHELDAVSPGQTGHYMVGEDLRYTPLRRFSFAMPGKAAEGTVRVGASVCTDMKSAASWSMTASGHTVTVPVAPTPAGDEYHGVVTERWTEDFTVGNDNVEVTLELNSITGNARGAWIDWIAVNYSREIRLAHTPSIVFTTDAPGVELSGCREETRIWDVTDPLAITGVRATVDGGVAKFAVAGGGRRTYAAFTPGMDVGLPVPEYVSRVANQNLHGLRDVDMIIFTSPTFLAPARRLAQHRRDFSGLETAVVVQDDVFNEFSSGCRDVGAFRKMLKMLYDRGADGSRRPGYVLMMGRGSYDSRCVTKAVAVLAYDPVPLWQSDQGLNDNTSFTSDDPIAMLADGSGADLGSDVLSVAIGRLAVTSASEAGTVVSKIIEYETGTRDGGAWRQRAVVIADDDDDCVHMRQAEEHCAAIASSRFGARMVVDKIYLDAYPLRGGEATGARDELFRDLDDGVVWLSYLGHASSTALSGEGIMKYSDVSALYLRHIPFIFAATCNFMRWDADAVSGAEMLAATKGGGVIGAISATRPVYINQNGLFASAVGEEMGGCGSDGRPRTIGEIMMRSKNRLRGDSNKLRYALLGDPAMRPALAAHSVVVDSIDGVAVDPADPSAIKARQTVVVAGHVEDASGAALPTFDGYVASTLYDADESVVTEGRGGSPFTFDRHGLRLFAGRDTVGGGRFSISVAMPEYVADNYREASLALFAEASDGITAAGNFRNFYVYGSDSDAEPDTVAPRIESMWLNHRSFTSGGTVNATPMLIAAISDDRAINLSLAGVGRSMTVTIDNGAIVCDDVSSYYYPSSVSSGEIRYTLPPLDDGFHTLTLRVWDTGGNQASETLEFFVDSSSLPAVYDIYTSSTPSSSAARFYLVHDRPDATLRVTVAVYDMLGRPVWIKTSTGRSDLFTSCPVEWDLHDLGGRRVPRGIYLYRAWVSEYNGAAGSGAETATPTRKMAIAGE